MSEVLLERVNGVAEIILNRPARRNAITREMLIAMLNTFELLKADDSISVVILRGAEGFFCSGLDLKEIDPINPPTADAIAAHSALAAMPVPIVAAVEGAAINAGAALALACDLLVCGRNSYLQIKEAEMGITPPINAAWLALRYPLSIGLQLALSCRRFGGEELYRLGMALDVVEDADVLNHARDLAGRMSAFPQHGAARTKMTILRARLETGSPFESAVAAALSARSAK